MSPASNPAPGRILAVDLGARRVGLALSDPMRMISSPLATIPMASESGLTETLLSLCAEKDVRLVVVGLPLSADGTEGPGCARSRRILERLTAAGMAAVLQDESWTSRDAEAMVREAGGKRRGSRDRIDAVAASIILREYLSEASRP
jgi:putative Holliday junction resolvase